jgi:hypothetical protein
VNRRDEFDRESLRERVYGGATGGDGRQSLIGSLFAVSLFLLILSLSVRQVTEPSNALVMLESGIAVLTDVERLVEDEAPALRLLAEESSDNVFAIPGYPLSIAVEREELALSDEELIDRLLARSAALVYVEGISAFDTTGEQRLNRFSSQGLLEFAVGQVSETTHNRATIGAIVFAIATAGFAVLFLVTAVGWSRMRGLGVATIVGSLPGILFFVLLSWVAGQIGGTDPFMADLREITRAGIRVPLRNFGIVFMAGSVITVFGVILAIADRRLDRREAWSDGSPEPVEEEAF